MWSECHVCTTIRTPLKTRIEWYQGQHEGTPVCRAIKETKWPFLAKMRLSISLPILHGSSCKNMRQKALSSTFQMIYYSQELTQREPCQAPCSGPLLVAPDLGSHFQATFSALFCGYVQIYALQQMYTCYIYIEPNRLPQQGPGEGGAGRCRICLPYLDAKKAPKSARKSAHKASKKRPQYH